MSLKGNLTDFDPLFNSKYCALTGVKLKHSKYIRPKTGRSLFL
jgi:hypothetical protein